MILADKDPTMPHRHFSAFALLAAATMLTAACGSTVQTTGSGPLGGVAVTPGGLSTGSDASLGVPGGATGPNQTVPVTDPTGPGAAGPVGDGPFTSGESPAGSGGDGVGGGGGGGSEASAGGSTGGPAAGSAQVGPGVTATEILIGRLRIDNAGAANQAKGFAIPDAPTDEYDAAMVKYINDRGGAAGRRIKLDYYTKDANGSKSETTVEQEACDRWTNDKRVFAVMAGPPQGDNLRSCLAKKGIPQQYENVFSNSDSKTFSTFRSYYEINAISLTHLAAALPDQLAAGGYFTPGAKIGVITFDGNTHKRAVAEQLKPALARRGLKLDEKGEAYVHTPQSPQDQSNSAAEIPGIVLQFKAAGIDHVMILGDMGGGLLIFFSKAAVSQDYHPKYGLTSASAPQAVIDGKLVEPDELKGAVTAGWNPLGDVGRRPHTRFGAGYKLCESIMKQAKLPFDTINNTVIALKTCDGFFFLAAAINRGAPSVTLQSYISGAESLGGSYSSALAYGAEVRSDARDGVSVLATTVYEPSCTCFMYRGELRRLR